MIAEPRDAGTTLIGSIVAIALIVLVSIAAARLTAGVESTVDTLIDRGLMIVELARLEHAVTRVAQTDPIDRTISITNDESGLVVQTKDGPERFTRLRVHAVRIIRSPLPAIVVYIFDRGMTRCWTIVGPFALFDPGDDP
ncbi:MAG: hypothetical protein EA382_02285 [Spirochaetaceae bacterium]|nr:MAG: hypothetical protein EA382_02285 [Spirochaetaceae bacterium]